MEKIDDTEKKINQILFFLGLLGLLSFFWVPVNIVSQSTRFNISLWEFQVSTFLNQAFLLLITLVLGYKTAYKVNLTTPLIRAILGRKKSKNILTIQLKWGVVCGIVSGFILIISSWICNPFSNNILIQNIRPDKSFPLITKILYGGITEEIMLRWGVMSFLVYIFSHIFCVKKVPEIAFWLGICLSALLFGLLHLPVVFQSEGVITWTIFIYIVAGNTFFGLIAGWLYWKKGLECSIFAHISFHIFIYVVNCTIVFFKS